MDQNGDLKWTGLMKLRAVTLVGILANGVATLVSLVRGRYADGLIFLGLALLLCAFGFAISRDGDDARR